MQPTPESYDAVVDWWTSSNPDQTDIDVVAEVFRCLELDTLQPRFKVVRDRYARHRDVVIPRPGLRVLVDYFPEAPPGRFHIANIFIDPDGTATDDDPWALPPP